MFLMIVVQQGRKGSDVRFWGKISWSIFVGCLMCDWGHGELICSVQMSNIQSDIHICCDTNQRNQNKSEHHTKKRRVRHDKVWNASGQILEKSGTSLEVFQKQWKTGLQQVKNHIRNKSNITEKSRKSLGHVRKKTRARKVRIKRFRNQNKSEHHTKKEG